MQLEQYISDLLYRYECVIVPEFGAFLSQYQSARIHEGTHAFYPPQKRLSFNGQLVESDGLLANYIAKSKEITHEAATQEIKSYVRFLFSQLHQEGKITLAGIGGFTFVEENKLQFAPSYQVNYLTEAFGLEMTVQPAILREAYKEEVIALEAKTPIAFTPERRTKGWLKYAAVGLIAIATAAGVAGYSYLKGVETHNYAAKQEAEAQLESTIQQATFVIDNPLPAVTISLSKPKGNYHIVAGAFRDQDNADKRVEQLRAQGYNAREIGTNTFGLHQVAYDSYTTGKEALTVLRTIRKIDNKDAWLLVKKLD